MDSDRPTRLFIHSPRRQGQDAWPGVSSVKRWSTTNVPWGHGIRSAMLADIPTLVVTGGWNDEYEAIASVLAESGAHHHVLSGATHRPQDVAGFGSLVEEFEGTILG